MFRYIYSRQYDPFRNSSPFAVVKGNEWLLQRMSLFRLHEVHRGCVNTVVWDANGELLLSGSDDQHLVICDPWRGTVHHQVHTTHRANVFSAKFLPYSSNRRVVSCSGDGMILFTDLDRQEETRECKFTCHVGTCYDIMTLPDDPHTFLSCGEDGTVRWFDLRIKESCQLRNCPEDILLNMGRAVTAIAINPLIPFHLAVATQDSFVRIYDRRMLGTRATDSYLEESNQALLMRFKPPGLESKSHRITSLRYSHRGHEVLASYSSDYLYLFDTQTYKEVPLEGVNGTDSEEGGIGGAGPTLKRLRLRGDWSDTGPQALPESEIRTQTGDVGQARPSLHSTLMQRMTDVLSRMLNDPGTRAAVHRAAAERSRTLSPPEEGHEEAAATAEDATQSSTVSMQNDLSCKNKKLPEILSSASEKTEVNMVTEVSSSDAIQSQSATCSTQSESPLPCSFPQPSTSDETHYSANENTESNIECKTNSTSRSSDAVISSKFSEKHFTTGVQEKAYKDTKDDEPISQAQNSKGDDSRRVALECQSKEAEESSQPFIKVMQSSIAGIQDTLTSLRQGFVDRHRVEPAVNLTYSGQGVSGGLISLEVGDEVERDYTTPSLHLEGATAMPEGFSKSEEAETDPVDDACSSVRQTADSKYDIDISDSKYDTESRVPLECDEAVNNSTSHNNKSGIKMSELTDIQTCVAAGKECTSDTCETSVSDICDNMEVDPVTELNSSHTTSVEEKQQNLSFSQAVANTIPEKIEHVFGGGDDTEDDATVSTSRRVARAIDRAVLQVRGGQLRKVDGPLNYTVPQGSVLQQFRGHRNARTMIKEACFWGDNHVMSGSDCGRVFVWDRSSGKLVMLWEADRHVVNCLQPHPSLPVLATSGIDYDVKLWAPVCDEPHFDADKAAEITRRNEALLEETRDTITVPATFMIRMLASLNQIRRGNQETIQTSDLFDYPSSHESHQGWIIGTVL